MRLKFATIACLLAANTSVMAAPEPIVRDSNGDFEIDSSASFASSGLTLDIRRFVGPFPDERTGGVPRRPRLNAMSYAPGIDGLFVVSAGAAFDPDAEGKVLHVSADGSTITEVLDVSRFYTLPKDDNVFWQQGGLRSVTFHPEFSQQGADGYGKLYTSQTVTRPSDTSGLNYVGPMNPALTTNNNRNLDRHDGSIVEWDATFNPGGSITSINSPRELYRVATPSANHPIKEAAFNPHARPGDEDYGLLYVLHPDGTNTNFNESGTGQVGHDALGKVFRINPLQDGANPYSVPGSNPFVGNDGQAPGGGDVLDEVFALGFRDQHTIAFARNESGDDHIIVSDIGSRFVEEIDLVVKGGNYGWNEREGTFVFNPAPSYTTSDLPPGDDGYIYPAAQYGHGGGAHAIAGGYVVDNSSELDGQFFFGDFASGGSDMLVVSLNDLLDATTTGDNEDLAPAEILTVDLAFDHDDDPDTPSIPKSSFLDILNDESSYDGSGRTDLRFGQGQGGEIYLLNKRNGYIYLVTNSVAPVPEPGSLALLTLGTTLAIRRRSSRSH